MKQIMILGAVAMLTACGGDNTPKEVKPVSDNRSCSERMYDLGETIRNMHYLGYSRSSAMNQLGEAGYQLRDFIGVVWSQPSGYWAKGEIGSQLRAEAIRQGCV